MTALTLEQLALLDTEIVSGFFDAVETKIADKEILLCKLEDVQGAIMSPIKSGTHPKHTRVVYSQETGSTDKTIPGFEISANVYGYQSDKILIGALEVRKKDFKPEDTGTWLEEIAKKVSAAFGTRYTIVDRSDDEYIELKFADTRLRDSLRSYMVITLAATGVVQMRFYLKDPYDGIQDRNLAWPAALSLKEIRDGFYRMFQLLEPENVEIRNPADKPLYEKLQLTNEALREGLSLVSDTQHIGTITTDCGAPFEILLALKKKGVNWQSHEALYEVERIKIKYLDPKPYGGHDTKVRAQVRKESRHAINNLLNFFAGEFDHTAYISPFFQDASEQQPGEASSYAEPALDLPVPDDDGDISFTLPSENYEEITPFTSVDGDTDSVVEDAPKLSLDARIFDRVMPVVSVRNGRTIDIKFCAKSSNQSAAAPHALYLTSPQLELITYRMAVVLHRAEGFYHAMARENK
ncbi:TPA: hypothetical protein HA246_03590 [Candidatus Woesearchaeota archaeon]|nr:hypothetical protein [Candidatus Woesearchaeota archaeon]